MTSYDPVRATCIRYALIAGACCSLLLPQSLASALTAPRPAAQPATGDRPAAVLESRAIGWPEVAPLLAEAAGAVVLEEVILERALEQACLDQSVAVGEPELRFERDLLVTSLARAADVPASEGERLIRDIRTSRGLGERRFAGLLKRNAMLRALVRKEAGPGRVLVTAEDINQAHQLRYGARIRARLILVRTQEQAADASRRLAAGESFADVATMVSADPSRLRGGLLDPISPADPSYPVAFRRALEEVQPGTWSNAIMVTWDAQPGFAIVRVEERLAPANVSIESVAGSLEEEIRAVRERALMDRLARSLIDAQAARLSVLDDALEWSWRSRRGG